MNAGPLLGLLFRAFNPFSLTLFSPIPCQMNERRPSWKCPVCNSPLRAADLRKDLYMAEVLKETGEAEEQVRRRALPGRGQHRSDGRRIVSLSLSLSSRLPTHRHARLLFFAPRFCSTRTGRGQRQRCHSRHQQSVAPPTRGGRRSAVATTPHPPPRQQLGRRHSRPPP